MKFTLFHFSDSHWIPRWTDPTDNDKIHFPDKGVVDFYNDYISDFDELNLKPYYGDTTILVHTGDFAHFPSKRESVAIPPIRQMFEDIRSRHIPTFNEKFSDVDDKLAVPGNHDADRKAIDKDDRFAHFRAMLGDDWTTPFDRPVARYAIKDCGEKQIAVSLFNSVSATIDEKTGEIHPEIAIDHDAMKTRRPVSDYFRIALLHHNLLPHYGQRANRDVFVNGGTFNSHLGDNNFKLVLSGHQHLGNETLFAVPTRLGESRFASPTLESVFLTIAAPSFLRPEKDVEIGFNVIEIEITNESNFATITLHKFRHSREWHPSGFRKEPALVFQLLVPRISSSTLSQNEQEERIQVAREVVDCFYDSHFDITVIRSALSSFSRTEHFQKVRRALQRCQQLQNNIAAYYSVAVLPPSYWFHAEPVLRRLCIEHAGRASARGGRGRAIQIYQLSISAPLATAIQNARSNAIVLSIADQVRKKKCDKAHWCEARLAWDAANEASLSVWELEDYSRGDKLVTRGIRLEPTGNEIVPTLEDWDKGNSPDTIEIVRIAIWPPKFFDDPEAARVIEMHEDYLVPLFWLSPARLRARADSEGIRRPRSDWGYDLIYARKYKDPNATDETLLHERPLRFVNDNRGKVPQRKYDEDRPDAYANDLWGHAGAPAHYGRHDTHLSAEFSTLLRRPDILFAVDAYAMRCAGLLDDVTSTLNEQYGLCDDWLNQ